NSGSARLCRKAATSLRHAAQAMPRTPSGTAETGLIRAKGSTSCRRRNISAKATGSVRPSRLNRRALKPLSLLANQPPQSLLIRRQKLGDPLVVDVGDDDLADLGVNLAKDAVRSHLCDLVLVVLGGGDVVHRVRLEAVHQE